MSDEQSLKDWLEQAERMAAAEGVSVIDVIRATDLEAGAKKAKASFNREDAGAQQDLRERYNEEKRKIRRGNVYGFSQLRAKYRSLGLDI